MKNFAQKLLIGPGSMCTRGGSIDTELRKEICRWGGRGGEGMGVNQWSTWKGSVMTLEGSPLTMLILGELIDTQLGKDHFAMTLLKDYF